MTPMHRYVIIGAGAIGGAVGALLTTHGIPAVLVARGDHLATMREHGVLLRTADGESRVPVVTAGGPAEVELTEDDVLVLAVKTHQAEAALAQWADVPVLGGGTAGERLPILTALNGVEAEARALRWFHRVFGVCVWMPAFRVQPGEVTLRANPVGMLHIGRFPLVERDPAVAGADRALLDVISADWEGAGLVVRLPADVMAWKYRKLLDNLGNAVQALVGEARAAGEDHGQDVVEAARAEAREVFAAAGVPVTGNEEERREREVLQYRTVPGAPVRMGGSTWQSMMRGAGTTEADFLNGEVVALARAIGLDAPVNAALTRETRLAAIRGHRPGEMSAAELRRRLGL